MKISVLIQTIVLTLSVSIPVYAKDITHDLWDVLLQQQVYNGLVDYAHFNRPALKRYLAELDKMQLEGLSTNQQLALWINAYNAYTIELVLNNYPLKSIKDISKPWDHKSARVGGKLYSLNEIEHEILRKKFKDPRIHFAIVCASIGCPQLLSRAYTAEKIEQQLDTQARLFFSTHATVEKGFFGGETLTTSKILSWFSEDFGSSERERLQFIARYAPVEIQHKIKVNPKMSLSYSSYNWNINAQK